MKRICLLAVTLLLLGACGSPLEHTVAKTMDQECQWLRWFASLPICHPYAAPQKLPPEPEVICYRTIGEVECHAQAIDGWTPVGSS